MSLTNLQIDHAKKEVGLDNFVSDEGPFGYFSQDIHIFHMKGNDGDAKAFFATQPKGLRFNKKADLSRMKIYKFDQLMTDADRKVRSRIRNKTNRISELEEKLTDAETVNDSTFTEQATFWLAWLIIVGAVGGSIYYIFREGQSPLTIDQMRNLLIAITSAAVTYVFFQAKPKVLEVILKRFRNDGSTSNGDE
jgi:hypothetical protein